MGAEKRYRNDSPGGLKVSPGPGTYAQRSFVGEGPKIGIKARGKETTELNKSMGPGPGTYQPNMFSVMEKPPAIGLGHGSRSGALNRSAVTVPGPGAYYSATLDKREGPKYGFGSSKRGEAKPMQTPGPGNYAIPGTIGSLPDYERSKHL